MGKKLIRKIISTVLCSVIAFSMIIPSGTHAEYSNEGVDENSTEIKPQIDFKYLGVVPQNPMQGQDFTVRYEISPQPFQHNITSPKEIVLVLDKSGSMDGTKMTNLKNAALKFIDSLTATNIDGITPKITNLKVGIIAYSRMGVKETELLEVTGTTNVNKNNKSILKEAIRGLDASGGTNTGDGLRKGATMLEGGLFNSNKTMILMSDGLPTYYSYYNKKQPIKEWECECSRKICGKSKCTENTPCENAHNNKGKCRLVDKIEEINEYYTELDYTDPERGGTGSSDKDGKSLEYATVIGNIIKSKNYNVFSIGYGLGNSTSDANKKLKQIHESMGGVSDGEESTFFATDTGAIDSVFNKIADQLEKSYSFTDAELNLNLTSSITAVEGFETTDSQGNKIKIKPIIYQLSENNWYRAESQIIEFKVNSNTVGDIKLFDENSKFTYTDINGIKREFEIESPVINIRPFEAGDNQKLQVDFTDLSNGYLIGDNIDARVTLTHPGQTDVTFINSKFTLGELPNNIVNTSDSSVLEFGTISSSVYKDYKLKINDDKSINAQSEKIYTLNGDYNYDVRNKNGATNKQSGTKEKDIKVKRGQIKVKVVDEEGEDITDLSTVVAKGKSIESEVNGVYRDEYILFDTVVSGNYELLIKSLPDGCEIPEGGNNSIVNVNFDNNIVTYIFKVNGTYIRDGIAEIQTNLIGYVPAVPYLDEDITVTYEILPQEFTYKNSSSSIVFDDAKLEFNLGNNFEAIEGLREQNGKYILDLEPIEYELDSGVYTSESFRITFKVRATKSGNSLTFKNCSIKYSNKLSEENTLIENAIDVPIMNINKVPNIPEYNGADIRILEVEPADSFKITEKTDGSQIKTGTEKISKAIQNKTVEVTHMTMTEFIGKVDDLNGKYDVVVIGKYKDNRISENNYKYRDYKSLENDITNRKAEEIRDFINSGQLVYIDSEIASVSNSKLKRHSTDINGYWNQSTDNLIKNKSVNGSGDTQINLENIVNTYLQKINSTPNMIRPIVQSSILQSDTNEEDLGDIHKRNMRFDINFSRIQDEDVTVKLYLDINGDGLFKSEENVKTIENVNASKDRYTFKYNFYEEYPQFIGYLDWRIEIIKPTYGSYSKPITSYVDGNVLFRRLTTEKREINVLQVSPYGKNELEDRIDRNLNLGTNTRFQELISQLKDYDIKVDVISYEDFYPNWGTGKVEGDLKSSKYNIVIAGFADSFNGKNLSSKSIKQMKEYVKSGQGLMLTHDSIFYQNEDIRYTSEIIKEFRDIIGQSRYKDEHNQTEEDINGELIPHDPDKPNGYYGEGVGATSWRKYNVNESNSTEVYKTNEALITMYPFELGDTIRVRRTHGQYLQLNFEDENVVPWFNLTENNNNGENAPWHGTANLVNRYDSMNSYYTYSKGNITFSGTGENQREYIQYPDSELKLFVNTIVKAERGANHKPNITALEDIYEIAVDKDLTFNSIVKDIDGDKVKVNSVIVDGSNISRDNNLPSDLKNQGSTFLINVDKKYFKNKNGQEVNISIEAEDAKGAVATKTYKVKPTQDPLLQAGEQTVEALTGDKVPVKIKLDKVNYNEDYSTISDIRISQDFSLGETISITNMSILNEGNEYYLVCDLTPLMQLSGENISIPISYKSNGIEKTTIAKIIVNSINGQITVNLKGINGENLGISPNVTLTNTTNKNTYTGTISSSTGQLVKDSLSSGDYNIEVKADGYLINQNSQLSTNLSYTDSKKVLDIILLSEVEELQHGLQNGSMDVLENESGFEVAEGMGVNFAAKLKMGGIMPIFLSIDENLSVDKDKIKVYQIVDNRKVSLKSNIKLDGEDYRIDITDSFSETVGNKEILITYSSKIPNSKGIRYTNEIRVNVDNKASVTIYTKENTQSNLPDLF